MLSIYLFKHIIIDQFGVWEQHDEQKKMLFPQGVGNQAS